MIPRYATTYSWRDIHNAVKTAYASDPGESLKRALQRLYSAKYVYLFSEARIALRALLEARGSSGEVVVPAYNCIGVPDAVKSTGHKVVFADIDTETFNMTPKTLASVLTPATSAVMLTHQFGLPADVAGLKSLCREHGVFVIEDAAAAVGAMYQGNMVGSFGDACIISFNFAKVFSGAGGGALLLNDDALAAKVERIISTSKYSKLALAPLATAVLWKIILSNGFFSFVRRGYSLTNNDPSNYTEIAQNAELCREIPVNSFCSGFQAAMADIHLGRLHDILKRRREIAELYAARLKGLSFIKLPCTIENTLPAWIQFPVRVADRKPFYDYMLKNGVDLSWTFKYSCADSYDVRTCPNSYNAAQTTLGLPTYPSLLDKEAEYICDRIRDYSGNR